MVHCQCFNDCNSWLKLEGTALSMPMVIHRFNLTSAGTVIIQERFHMCAGPGFKPKVVKKADWNQSGHWNTLHGLTEYIILFMNLPLQDFLLQYFKNETSWFRLFHASFVYCSSTTMMRFHWPDINQNNRRYHTRPRWTFIIILTEKSLLLKNKQTNKQRKQQHVCQYIIGVHPKTPTGNVLITKTEYQALNGQDSVFQFQRLSAIYHGLITTGSSRGWPEFIG